MPITDRAMIPTRTAALTILSSIRSIPFAANRMSGGIQIKQYLFTSMGRTVIDMNNTSAIGTTNHHASTMRGHHSRLSLDRRNNRYVDQQVAQQSAPYIASISLFPGDVGYSPFPASDESTLINS